MATVQVGTNSPTLTLNNVTLEQSGNQYYCEVRDSSGQLVISNNAILLVTEDVGSQTPPVITQQPQNIVMTEGDTNPTFSVIATDASTYLWKEYDTNEDKFMPLNGITGYSGATTNTLTVLAPLVTSSPRTFMCDVTNQYGTTLSNSVTLVVNEEIIVINPPVIDTFSSSPTNEADLNQDVIFTTLLLSGEPNFTYTWYRRSDVELGWSVNRTVSNSNISDNYTTSISSQIGETWMEVYCKITNAGGTVDTEIIRIEEKAEVIDPQSPPAPSNLVANISGNNISLTWEYNSGYDIAGWKVERSINGGAWVRLIKSSNTSLRSYTDSNVVSGTISYFVRSYSNYGSGEINNPITYVYDLVI